MRHLTSAALILFGTGALVAVVGAHWDSDTFTFGGITVIGLAGVLLGLDAVVTRRLITVSRYSRRASETWLGAAAVGQGVTIVFTGLFLAGTAILALLDSGRAAVVLLARHPGPALLAFAALCLAAATTAITGSVEEKLGERWLVLLNLAVSRLLPGAILILLGLASALLGLLEIVAPATFDRLGGGFLEVLFGAAPPRR